MGYARRQTVPITTDSSGDAIGYTASDNGSVYAVIYTKTDFADGVDVTITAEATGEAILTLVNQNASGRWYPRTPVHDTADGTEHEIASGYTDVTPIFMANDRVKIVIAQGGDTKSGSFDVVMV